MKTGEQNWRLGTEKDPSMGMHALGWIFALGFVLASLLCFSWLEWLGLG